MRAPFVSIWWRFPSRGNVGGPVHSLVISKYFSRCTMKKFEQLIAYCWIKGGFLCWEELVFGWWWRRSPWEYENSTETMAQCMRVLKPSQTPYQLPIRIHSWDSFTQSIHSFALNFTLLRYLLRDYIEQPAGTRGNSHIWEFMRIIGFMHGIIHAWKTSLWAFILGPLYYERPALD
jgi:hypothetical protein